MKTNKQTKPTKPKKVKPTNNQKTKIEAVLSYHWRVEGMYVSCWEQWLVPGKCCLGVVTSQWHQRCCLSAVLCLSHVCEHKEKSQDPSFQWRYSVRSSPSQQCKKRPLLPWVKLLPDPTGMLRQELRFLAALQNWKDIFEVGSGKGSWARKWEICLSNPGVALIGLGPSLTAPTTGCWVMTASTVLVSSPGGCAVTTPSSESRIPVQGGVAWRERRDVVLSWENVELAPFRMGDLLPKMANQEEETNYFSFLWIFLHLIIPKKSRGLSWTYLLPVFLLNM